MLNLFQHLILNQVQNDDLFSSSSKDTLVLCKPCSRSRFFNYITMKKISIFLLGVVVVVLPIIGALQQSRAAVAPSVLAYLESVNPQTDWTVIARRALGGSVSNASFLKELDGSSANDYATYILAITALGEDPRSFGNENLVYGLGQLSSSGQIGESAYLNDDIFSLLALKAAGVSNSDSLVTQEVNYIKSKQTLDGGWSWDATASEAMVDYTAMGIMSLLSAGVDKTDSSISDAVEYLTNAQNNDGGFGMSDGDLSNTASTAWGLSAINALGESVSFYAPAGISPVDYLEARLQESGYFLFDANASSPDLFTPVSSSYAGIALAGKFYPVTSISSPATVSLRIEGADDTVCVLDTAQGRTALDVIKSSSAECGYTYAIQDTQYGPYLTTIASEAASGMDGWSYLPNYEMAQVGAGDYVLSNGDDVLWYYGAWDALPLRVVHSESSVSVGDTTVATIEQYNNGSWQALAGATLKRGSESFVTNAQGQVTLSWEQDGAYYLYAEADASVRSEKILVISGNGGSSQSIEMSVIIGSSGSKNLGTGGEEPGKSSVIFGVSGDLSFGTLVPGQSATKQATITNNGSVAMSTTAQVEGSQLFVANTRLDNVSPVQWQKVISSDSSSVVNVTLSVPASYSGFGQEQGTLIFWANAMQ